MTLTRDFSYEQLVTIKAFFTQAEWDTIDAALEEYFDEYFTDTIQEVIENVEEAK